MSSEYTFSQEQSAEANNISICYQTIGDPQGSPLLLVMGLGVQMIGWPPKFCQMLAEAGFYVIRFDNRDVGKSTQFDDAPALRKREIMGNHLFGRNFPIKYTLDDMADDAVGLLDALNIDAAHIVGASMGGMISQLITLNHPERVLTLTSIMSTTNERDLPQATVKARAILLKPRPTEFEKYLQTAIASFEYFNGTTFAYDEEYMRNYLTESWERASSITGVGRQLAAVLNTPGRRKRLREVTTPTLIIHGDADPLVPYPHGIDTAEAIPTARLVTIRGMGHTLPQAAWSTMVQAISQHAQVIKREPTLV